jgi:hypothetical protein
MDEEDVTTETSTLWSLSGVDNATWTCVKAGTYEIHFRVDTGLPEPSSAGGSEYALRTTHGLGEYYWHTLITEEDGSGGGRGQAIGFQMIEAAVDDDYYIYYSIDSVVQQRASQIIFRRLGD